MNKIHSMARITAQRAIYDYGDYHRQPRSLTPADLLRIAAWCLGTAMVVLWWWAQVI